MRLKIDFARGVRFGQSFSMFTRSAGQPPYSIRVRWLWAKRRQGVVTVTPSMLVRLKADFYGCTSRYGHIVQSTTVVLTALVTSVA